MCKNVTGLSAAYTVSIYPWSRFRIRFLFPPTHYETLYTRKPWSGVSKFWLRQRTLTMEFFFVDRCKTLLSSRHRSRDLKLHHFHRQQYEHCVLSYYYQHCAYFKSPDCGSIWWTYIAWGTRDNWISDTCREPYMSRGRGIGYSDAQKRRRRCPEM